jgi:hypothetical protein
MSKEEVEQAFNGISPYYAYKQGVQDGMAYNEESFRREAAKDFVVALVSSGNGLNPKNIAYSIEMADELIKQLKEK